jgi:hypothetical protein
MTVRKRNSAPGRRKGPESYRLCREGGHEFSGSAYVTGGATLCLRHALLQRHLLLRSLKVAALVGTVLVAINQLDIVAHGQHGPEVAAKIGLTYAVPFCVATFSALATIRQPREDRRADG